MKVYVVIQYQNNECKVLDIYANIDAAIQRVDRLHSKYLYIQDTTYHIISKSVKGLAGVKFKFDGKKRYLEANIIKHK